MSMILSYKVSSYFSKIDMLKIFFNIGNIFEVRNSEDTKAYSEKSASSP